MTNLVSRTLLIISGLAVIHLNVIAQKIYTRLHIGDGIPDVKFNTVRNYSFPKKSLSDFKGKFIILDIWDKGCESCIEGMPQMEKLQRKFSKDLQILLVTVNKENELSILFKNSPILQNVRLPMAIGDTIIAKHFFPYKRAGKHIWIDRDGKVIAITQSPEATDTNISRMIQGEKLHLTTREDIVDPEENAELDNLNKPLILASNSKYIANLYYYRRHNRFRVMSSYYSSILKRINGAHDYYQAVLYGKEGKEEGFRFINNSVYSIFRFAYNDPSVVKTVVENGVPLPKEPSGYEEHLKWEDEMSFCYDIRMQNTYDNNYKFRDRMYLQMQDDLEKCFGIKGRVQEMPVKCFVLYKDSIYDKKFTLAQQNLNGGEDLAGRLFSHVPFEDVVIEMKACTTFESPVLINETGLLHETVTMTLRTDLKNLAALQDDFGRYGINVKEETRNLKVLILKKAKE